MTTNYITPRVDIDDRDFDKDMCSAYPYFILENHCVEKDKSCHIYFIGVGK